MRSLARHAPDISAINLKIADISLLAEVNIMTIEELEHEIEEIKSKKTRTIYDFNKLRKLEKELEEIKNGNNEEAEV